MGLFAILSTIDETKLDLLGQLRASHYAFLVSQRDRIRFGGPARTVEGGRPETMIIVVEADTLEDAERWIDSEPYNARGGFKSVVVRPWSQVLPEAQPGGLEATLEAERRLIWAHEPGDDGSKATPGAISTSQRV